MVGDGMGVSQIYAGLTANHGRLNLEQFKVIGFHRNQASDNYITDSAAGATAFATGKKPIMAPSDWTQHKTRASHF